MTLALPRWLRIVAALALPVFAGLATLLVACSGTGPAETRFEISFPAVIHATPVTGRAFVVVSRGGPPEPRLQAGSWTGPASFFGWDVDQLQPGTSAALDKTVLGYPLQSISQIPAGDYDVQGLLNVYTEFHRSDGHVIWAHMDQWEGQQFNRSPGNLYSKVQRVHLDPNAGSTIKLSLDQVIPPVEMPADTEWVKHVKIQSKLLSAFWGQPIYLGATVLLPRGYGSHPDVQYPAIYIQGHFGLGEPFGFSTQDAPDTEEARQRRQATGTERGYDFYQAWNSERFPRMIAITFQHPTQYFDDSYAVNSVNNGPYGDALLTELVPYLEEHFRLLPKPYARVLTGGSTGGWESLALQVFHPDFFGGTWTFYPDPVDFRRYQMTNAYEDDNAFLMPGQFWVTPERFFRRDADGQPLNTMRQLSQLDAVLGSKGRSGQQLGAWEAAYGPIGDDGYPKPLWDKLTGRIDREVALYMRDHGYDLRYYLETNWPKIGPSLVGKLRIYCGDMDNYYLNLAVYQLEDFLKSTKDPFYAGSVEFGRPMKGHGWHPMTNAALVRMMAEQVTKNAAKGDSLAAWKY